MQKFSRILFPLAAIFCLWPEVSSASALILGAVLALTLSNPYMEKTKAFTPRLLAWSVIGLGAGMNLLVVGKVGFHGIGYTVIGITAALTIGLALGRLLKTEANTSMLITVGTAICGGSAIAAVAPVIRAKASEVSVALGTVFLLNAIALIIFPSIGHHFHMFEGAFGLWSALAIHDTSSVVGATMQYGAHALEVGTTVKLARALWIVPVALGVGYFFARKDQAAGEVKAKKPWFILGFLAMAAVVTWIPSLQSVGHLIEFAARRLLVVTLFLIGGNLTRETLESVGFKPFLQGVLLWLIMASGSLFVVLKSWISI